jgi:hypothetical protein
LHIHPEGDVDGLVHDPPLALDLYLKGVEVEDGVNGI